VERQVFLDGFDGAVGDQVPDVAELGFDHGSLVVVFLVLLLLLLLVFLFLLVTYSIKQGYVQND
jgi:hypothetical protein